MEKVYNKIGWENTPSVKTPLSAENLNKMDNALDEIDNRVIELNEHEEALQENLAAEVSARESAVSTLQANIEKNASQLKEDLTDLERRLKSGSIEDAELHLGLYIDEDGDICQKED